MKESDNELYDNLKTLYQLSKFIHYENMNVDGKKQRKKLKKMILRVEEGETNKMMKYEVEQDE